MQAAPLKQLGQGAAGGAAERMQQGEATLQEARTASTGCSTQEARVLQWCDTCPGQPVLVLSYNFRHAHVTDCGMATPQGVACDVPYPQYMACMLGAHLTIDKHGRSWLHAALT